MLDSSSTDCAIRPLRAIAPGDLVLRTGPTGQMELAVPIGEAQPDGVPVVVLKCASRPCPMPHADWWSPAQEAVSLGDEWCIEPVRQTETHHDFPQDGALLHDREGPKLKLWLGPDNLAPVAMLFDLTARRLTRHCDAASACFSAWTVWRSAADRSIAPSRPVFVYRSA